MSTETNAREHRAEARSRRRGAGPKDAEAATPHVQDALKTAASAAAVGAAVGAARAITARRQKAEDEPAEEEQRSTEAEAQPQPEPEEETEPEPEREKVEPASPRAVSELVAQARDVLHELHGSDAESVSFVARRGNAWVIGLEVLELRRIPDSTDVLATYEVELTTGGEVQRFERVRRYHRSEADRGGRG